MKLTDRMKYFHIPGASIAFFDHGQIQWACGYGKGDTTRTQLVDPHTQFQAGGISVTFSALLILKLAEEGRIQLDEDVNRQLQSWKLPDNGFTNKEKVTPRRILSNSSGLTVYGSPGYSPGEAVPSLLQVLDGEAPAKTKAVRVKSVPGETLLYSGGGFVILQLLATDVTGEFFPSTMQRYVLTPLNMFDSTFEQQLTGGPAHAAAGYNEIGVAYQGGHNFYPEMACAGLWTTPSDLARAAIQIQSAFLGGSQELLSQSDISMMLTHQAGNVGLGVALEAVGRQRYFSHTGSVKGFNAAFHAYLDSSQGVAIMTNGQQGRTLVDEIMRAVAHEYKWPDYRPVVHKAIHLPNSSLVPLVGDYELPGHSAIHVSLRRGRLYIDGEHFDRVEPLELVPETAQRFFTLATGSVAFTFQANPGGAVESLVIADETDPDFALLHHFSTGVARRKESNPAR